MVLQLDIASVRLVPPAGLGPGMHHFASELLMVACHHLDDNHFDWSSFRFFLQVFTYLSEQWECAILHMNADGFVSSFG